VAQRVRNGLHILREPNVGGSPRGAPIRYTSLSLPYHIGYGVFGGLPPLIGVSVYAATHNIYAGLYYPLAIASLTFIAGSLLLKETRGTKVWDEVGGHASAVSSD